MTALGGLVPAFGTRDTPHAQARAARSQPVLLHSLSLFREVFEVVYRHREISTVVEIGVESGQVSSIYTDLGADRVYCVDPFPSDELRARLAEDDALQLVERPSPLVLDELPVADLYVIDGDHNYATVRGEVDWVLAHAPDAVVVLHDVLWPCSRRDQYYLPSLLSDAQRHPSSPDGPSVWTDELTPAGFVGAGVYDCAVEAGGEGNGVLTAVEDAMAAAADQGWRLVIVPAVFGVGVLVRETTATAGLLGELRPLTESRLLYAMENNRIALYTRVLQLQHDLDSLRSETARLTGSVAEQAALLAERERLLGEREAELQRQSQQREAVAMELQRCEQERDGLAEEARRLHQQVAELESARLAARARRVAAPVVRRVPGGTRLARRVLHRRLGD